VVHWWQDGSRRRENIQAEYGEATKEHRPIKLGQDELVRAFEYSYGSDGTAQHFALMALRKDESIWTRLKRPTVPHFGKDLRIREIVRAIKGPQWSSGLVLSWEILG